MEDNKFDKSLKLYVDFKIPQTVEEFVHDFLFTNCTSMGITKGLATYKDKECKYCQTSSGKYRSFDDIFVTVRTYFPDITISLLVKILLSLKNRDYPDLSACLRSCSDMRRIRLFYWKDAKNNCDIYGWQYDSCYSWRELLTIAGIERYVDFIGSNCIYIDVPDTFLSTKEGVFLADEFKTN